MTTNVLFLHKCFIQSGGIERVHQNLSLALKEVNVSSLFYVMNGFGESEKGFSALQANFEATRSESNVSFMQNIKDIVRIVKAQNISVIISATEKANLAAFICKLFVPKLCVIYTRHCAFDVSDQKLPPFAIKALYSLFALNGKIVAVSRALKAQIQSSILFNKDSVHFVPNAVISNDVFERSNEADFKPPATPYFIAVGRLVEQKGFDMLLSAYALALAKDSDLPNLLILGEGEDRKTLEALAGQLDITQKVNFAGFTTNPYAPIKNACAFVLSSRHEGMPTVLIEALALNTPVIAFDCPTGPSEIIDHGINGFLVEYLNTKALADAMLAYKSLPHKGLENGVSDFKFTTVANQYLSLCGAHADE